jgi:hypothetical protein
MFKAGTQTYTSEKENSRENLEKIGNSGICICGLRRSDIYGGCFCEGGVGEPPMERLPLGADDSAIYAEAGEQHVGKLAAIPIPGVFGLEQPVRGRLDRTPAAAYLCGRRPVQ